MKSIFSTLLLLTITLTYYSCCKDDCEMVEIYAVADANVASNYPESNFGDAESLNLYYWTNGGVPGYKHVFIRFDYEGYSAEDIEEATLVLSHNPTDSSESFDMHTGDNAVEMYRVSNGWDESTITWDNKPEVYDNSISIAPSIVGDQSIEVDITDWVKLELGGETTTYGYMLKIHDDSEIYSGWILSSKENQNPNLWPTVQICTKSERER